MPKKVLITLSLMGAALCNQDYMKTVFAEESRPSALLERSSVKIAITMENLNLRDKASTSGRILTTIPKGKTVTILSEKDENGWYKVSYDGKTGYVSRSYLTTSNSTPAVSKTGTATENLNLRDQPGTSGKILTTIPKGKTVTILSEKDENGWYKVSYGGKTGYVSGSYLTTSPSGSTTITTKTGTATENLNLRNQASLSGKILTTIPKGKTVTILSEKDENGWYKVSYDGKTGYAISNYIKEDDSNSEATESAPSKPTVSKTGTTTENLNLRNQASLSGKVLMTIPKGKTVTILSEKDENGWYKVSYDGKTGYAISNYIKEGDSNSESTESTPSTPVPIEGQPTENLNLRDQPSTSGKILTTIPKGKTVTILSEKNANGWYKVSYNGKTGYVSGSYFKVTKYEELEETVIWTGTVNTNESIVYKTADTSATTLTTYHAGQKVEVVKVQGDWVRIKYNDTYAWMLKKVVTQGNLPNSTILWDGEIGKDTKLYATKSTTSTVLNSLTKGTVVYVIEEDGDWLKIKHHDGYGYVQRVTVINLSIPTIPENILWTGKTTENLNVRNYPDVSGILLGTLTKGTIIEVVSEDSKGWLKIKYEHGYGYVNGSYVQKDDSQTPETPETTKQIAYVYNLDGGTLNVRPQPNTSQSAIGKLSEGEAVTIVGESGNWYEIEYNNSIAYVSKDYITFTPITPETPEITKQIAYVYNLDGGTLNVRPQPNTNQAAIGKLAEGEAVTIVGESGNWYEIEYNNSTGYVSKDYITFTPITPETPEITKQIAYVYNLDGGTLNVRPQPNTSQSAIGKLTEGEAVTIVGESGNWYEIEYNNSTGYVSKDYITFNKPNQHPDANIDFETTPRIGVVIDSVTSLNIRQEATTNSVILGTLTAKDEVSIIGRFNDFYKISYDDSYAYVHKDYVGVKATSNLNGRVSYLTTEYSYSLTKFAQIQQSYTSGTIQSITSYLNPNNPANVNYLLQYLRIDQFRSFDVAGLNKELQNKGVLHNQGQIFYNASRYYNIDPIFFVSQSIHETNWGTSNLAKGITITEIADENKPIKDSSGKIIDYERIQLDKPVTVYNLFGIGARDHAPRLLGTTYAYKKGWTTPEKAIFGAAEFISLNYINSPKYQQNTPFKIKYNQLSANQWHQYATTPWYAYEIGNYMHRFAYLYDDDQEFLLDIPVYK
ncbi:MULTISPECIES: SH3 domain-containing protein [unclassified Turicibacter]|uniref:SH3 domain-containing protein n=1 Tax=unclassified Turicibacter TaxID=2638206 RepID=UPI0006C286B4|nr:MULTISPECIES: SH3 domain-containing protein [unclassified Turicibacter]MCU7193417.1 SH3 domain-containing protein [Turicibacter sp. T129]MCU7207073.1 SH3 domain-containing protein [Turicibacter sp. GALT-G1]CUN56322.1 Beta-N-acetylglucosaminidase precursor [Turicibacter sanguinis]